MLTPWIAFRYFKSRRAGRFAWLLTATAITSVAIGMLSLILVMSVMQGFRKELAERLLGFNAHITLTRGEDAPPLTGDDIERIFSGAHLSDVSPFVQGEVVAQSGSSGEPIAQGARVRGIMPKETGAMRKVEFYFPGGGGDLNSLEWHVEGKDLHQAIIGNEIVSQLFVHPDFGDMIELIAPLAELLPSGELGPNSLMFEVVGVFRTGVYEYDSKYIIVSLSAAERLLGEQAESGWFVRLANATEVVDALAMARDGLPKGWKAQGWHEQNKKLFAALRLERIAMGCVLAMALLIASFAVVGVVLLITSAKRKDIAILESIGMTHHAIRRVFLMHSALIGLVGSVIGLVLGLGLCIIIRHWPIRLPESYYLDWLPVEINPLAAIAFGLLGVAIAVFAAIYPVRQAVKLNPIEVLRYE